jgi:hypothetical protein
MWVVERINTENYLVYISENGIMNPRVLYH